MIFLTNSNENLLYAKNWVGNKHISALDVFPGQASLSGPVASQELEEKGGSMVPLLSRIPASPESLLLTWVFCGAHQASVFSTSPHLQG